MANDEGFGKVFALVEHMCEELVDDSDTLQIDGAHVGVTGAIEITGPSTEIAKIIGSKRTTISAVEVIVNAVAAKHGFRILLNVINDERRRQLQGSPGELTLDSEAFRGVRQENE